MPEEKNHECLAIFEKIRKMEALEKIRKMGVSGKER